MKAKLAFIAAHGSTYSIRLLCAVLGVARSWFHEILRVCIEAV